MTVAGVFGLPHLSADAVAAFADGVLSGSAAARARRHCAECVECAEAVRTQREAALLLRAASTPSVPADLLSRLASVPMSAPLPPPRSGLPTVLGADGVPMFVAHDRRNADPLGPPFQPSSDRPQPGQQHSHRRVLLPVGILASAAAVVAAGTIGSQPAALPQPVEQQPASIQQLSTNLSGNGQRSGTPASIATQLDSGQAGARLLERSRTSQVPVRASQAQPANQSHSAGSVLPANQSHSAGSVLPAGSRPGQH